MNHSYNLKTIKNMPYETLQDYCQSIRTFLIEYFSTHGGHVGSNLETVELIVTLLKEFDYFEDYIFFDTGHQSYLMKLLTERPKPFETIRKLGGLSGFMDKWENPRDHFISGHGGTGIATAVGFSCSVDENQNRPCKNTICVIGDAALSEGLSFEAFNNATDKKNSRLILVINDNGWSIEKNVGNLARILSDTISAEQFFSLFGFKYHYCEDGHNVEKLGLAWREVKSHQSRCVLHVRTKKGFGLQYAESDNIRKMHYSEPFYLGNGQTKQTRGNAIRFVDINSRALSHLREKYSNIVAITSGMCGGNGLDDFKHQYPDSFIDVGMSEQYSICFANGLAIGGKIPFVVIHAAFLPRAFDQMLQDICLQNIHAIILVGRSGFAGPDGSTHHGVYDLTYLRCLPNLSIFSPKDGNEYYKLIHYTCEELRTPCVILTPHAYTTLDLSFISNMDIVQSIEEVYAGTDICVFTTGIIWEEAKKLCDSLNCVGYSMGLYHVRQIKSFNYDRCVDIMKKYKRVVVVEENSVIGGLGSEIAKLSAEDKSLPPVNIFGVPDRFFPYGDIPGLRKLSGISSDEIETALRKIIGRSPLQEKECAIK